MSTSACAASASRRARRVDAPLIVVPLAAMLVAGLFSRSRLPSERPAD